jgi:hypothetical protein
MPLLFAKNKDKKEIFNEIYSSINEEQPDCLLLLAWNLFEKNEAKKCVMTALEEKGFTIDVFYPGSKAKESVSYVFPDGPVESSKVSTVLGKLFIKNSGVSWPPGIMPFIVSFFWVFALIAAASEKDLVKYPILLFIHPYALMIFRESKYAIYALFFTIFAHTLEGLYVTYLCSVIKMPKTSIITWVSMVMIMGYPSLSQVMLLAHVAKNKKLRFD